jgi:hypothetical protein
MPPSSSSANYVAVGKDSIYCPGGALITMANGENMQGAAAGMKYRFEGDKLILNIRSKQSTIVAEGGLTQEDNFDVTCVLTLQR